MEVFLYLVLEFFFFTFCKQGFPLPLNVISQIISSYIFLQGVPKKHSYKIFCTAALMGWNKIWKIWKHAWVVAQDLVGRGVRAERPAHRDDRMLHCSHPMRAAAENFIRVFFLGHPVYALLSSLLVVFVDLVIIAQKLLITPTVSREWSLRTQFVIMSWLKRAIRNMLKRKKSLNCHKIWKKNICVNE